MGIKQLNRFLLNHCSKESISKRSLSELSHRAVVVDTSIYLYKFAENGTLVEGIYHLISIFRKYRIVPVFVFDGKPPVEKKDLLEKRKQDKIAAEHEYYRLKERVDQGETAPEKEVLSELDILKKRFVRITHTDIQTAKEVMEAYGATYIESWGEADQLCAYLVRKDYAWACVSDDMDMFLYGCPRVIRHLSLMNHTGVVYETESILSDIGMSFSAFRDVAVLSGTDYNIHAHTSLYKSMEWYSQYVAEVPPGEVPPGDVSPISFYDWLLKHTQYIRDIDRLEKARKMFDLSLFPITNQDEIRAIIHKYPFRNGEIQRDRLRAILQKDGFIFA